MIGTTANRVVLHSQPSTPQKFSVFLKHQINVSFGLKIGLYMSHLPLLNLPSYFFLDEKVGKK